MPTLELNWFWIRLFSMKPWKVVTETRYPQHVNKEKGTRDEGNASSWCRWKSCNDSFDNLFTCKEKQMLSGLSHRCGSFSFCNVTANNDVTEPENWKHQTQMLGKRKWKTSILWNQDTECKLKISRTLKHPSTFTAQRRKRKVGVLTYS